MTEKKCVLITGVSGGMGRAAEKKLISEGFSVFGLDIKEPEETPGLTFIKTDLTDASSVDEAFRKIEASGAKLDCIVNMAGIYDMNSLVEMSEEDFKKIFDVNVFASYRVNKTFLSLLSDGGRIIIVTSELAPLDPLPFTGIYGVTKAALEKYAASLRMELQLLGHPVSVIRPGAVDTALLGVSTSRLESFTENTKLYSYNAKRFYDIVARVEAKKVPPERVARLAFRAATAHRPKLFYNINRNPLLRILSALPDRLQCFIIKKILTENNKHAGKL